MTGRNQGPTTDDEHGAKAADASEDGAPASSEPTGGEVAGSEAEAEASTSGGAAGEDREFLTGEQLALRILGRTPSEPGQPRGPGQPVQSGVEATSVLDLSRVCLTERLVLHDCVLTEGLRVTDATLAGIELIDVHTPWVDLERATVEGDLRLIHVSQTEADTKDRTIVTCGGLEVGGRVVVAGSALDVDEGGPVAAPTAPGGDGAVSWELVGQVVGLASGLVAWVVVVGGATLWARLDSIGAPSLPVLAALGQEWMLTAGLQTLLVPILLGAAAALLLFFSRGHPYRTGSAAAAALRDAASTPATRPLVALHRLRVGIGRDAVPTALLTVGLVLLATFLFLVRASPVVLVVTVLVAVAVAVSGDRWGRARDRSVIALVIVLVLGVGAAVLATVTWGWAAVIVVVTVLIGWVALGAGVDRRPGAAALVLFVAVVVWSGTVQYAREAGARNPAFPDATVLLTGGGTVEGLLVGRTSEVVIVAEEAKQSDGWVVRVLPSEQAREVRYGGLVVLGADEVTTPAEPGEGDTNESSSSDTWQSVLDWLRQWLTTAPAPRSTPTPTPTTAPTPTPSGEPTGPPTPDPFETADASDHLDAVVGGVPARVELLGVRRSSGVAYLGLRAVNLDADRAHTVAELLGLDDAELDGPRLLDPEGLYVYEVSRSESVCDCTGGLDRVVLGPSEQRTLDATIVLPASVSVVDVWVPGFGTFRGVQVG